MLKHRLTKLYEMEGLRPGNWEFDRWSNEIKELRKRADGHGIGESADEEMGRFGTQSSSSSQGQHQQVVGA